MKLSDIKGERVLNVIADLIDPVANIAEDKEAIELFTRKKVPEGKTAKEFALERIKKSVPKLLKVHKNDIITILATLEGVSPAEYEKELNLLKLISDFTELLTDDAFMALFTSAAQTTEN